MDWSDVVCTKSLTNFFSKAVVLEFLVRISYEPAEVFGVVDIFAIAKFNEPVSVTGPERVMCPVLVFPASVVVPAK